MSEYDDWYDAQPTQELPPVPPAEGYPQQPAPHYPPRGNYPPRGQNPPQRHNAAPAKKKPNILCRLANCAIGLTTSMALFGGAAAAVVYYEDRAEINRDIRTDQVPDSIIPPAPLPSPVVSNLSAPITICPADAPDCNQQTALKSTGRAGFIPVTAADVPNNVYKGLIATEDRTFMTHNGVSMKGVMRAGAHDAGKIDIKNGVQFMIHNKSIKPSIGAFFPGTLEGGSTIERQLANTKYIGGKSGGGGFQEFLNQYHEAQYAKEIDILNGANTTNQKQHDAAKQKIILDYLNTEPFGPDIQGIQAASKFYFNKTLLELDQEGTKGEAEEDFVDGNPLHPYSITFAYTDLKCGNDPVHCNTPEFIDVEKQLTLAKQRTTEVNQSEYAVGYYGAVGSDKAKHKEAAVQDQIDKWAIQFDANTHQYLGVYPFAPYQPEGESGVAGTMCARNATTFIESEARRLLGKEIPAGARIISTLNTKDQNSMCNAFLADKILMNSKDIDASGVSEDPDGGVVAMVGSLHGNPNFAVGSMKVNGVKQGSDRLIGSSGKTFAIAEDYSQGATPDTVEQMPSGTYTVKAGDQYHKSLKILPGHNGCNIYHMHNDCKLTVKQAYAASSNDIPGIIMNEHGGPAPVGELERKLGVNVPDVNDPSIALGTNPNNPLAMATGYNAFPNGGKSVIPHIISQIILQDGTIAYDFTHDNKQEQVQAVTPEVAKEVLISEKAYAQIGTGKGELRGLPNGRQSAGGKTGTSDTTSDLWFDGVICDSQLKSRAFSFWAGNPRGYYSVKNEIPHSAYLAGGVARLYIKGVMSGNKCDIADLAGAH